VQIPIRLTDDKTEAESFIANTVETYTRGASHRKSDLYDTIEEHVRDSAFCGGVEEIKEQVDKWTNAGINHFILTTPRPFNSAMMERFAKEVTPAFS